MPRCSSIWYQLVVQGGNTFGGRVLAVVLFVGVDAGVHRRRLVERFRAPLGQPVARVGLARPTLGIVDLLATRRHLATSSGEVPLGRDPVVIEVGFGFLDRGQRDGRAVPG